MTDFENAAFAVFVVLLSRAILYFKLNFYIPISKVWYKFWHAAPVLSSSILAQVDENMGRAQERNASASRKFYFRKEVFSAAQSEPSSGTSSSGTSTPSDDSHKKKEKKMRNCFAPPPLPEDGILNRLPVDEEYDEFTMNEIMNGNLVRRPCRFGINFLTKVMSRERTFQVFCLWSMLTSTLWKSILMKWKRSKATWNLFDVVPTVCRIYLSLTRFWLMCWAIGTLLTPATWIRNFVQSHPDYHKDSVVSQVVNYDLLIAVDEM